MLLLTFVTLAGLYMYFVGMSVVHVVMNKEAAQQLSTLRSDISELETAYIDAQHSLSTEVALQHGFVPQENKVFIVSSDSSVVVSRND